MGHRLKLAVILAEYGKPAPDVTQYRETWPEADIQVFSGKDLPDVPELDPKHPRYGWRMNDYWKVRKMLDSGADVAMCFDADMRIVNRDAARTLPLLAERFGICLPVNPRYTVQRDFLDGADVTGATDQTMWYGPSLNCSPIVINLQDTERRQLAEQYCNLMLTHPERGPMVWWYAMLETGIAPLILPPQWCVCERHIGVGGEIILHEGHAAVKRHYAGMGSDGNWKHGA
jgi:hypothetical protein